MIKGRGFCKNCYKKGENPKFFDVNLKNNYVYCPHCGARLEMKEAVQNYSECFDDLYEKAEIDLFKACDYTKACEDYSNILMLDDSEVVARYGRILSLLNVSTLRNTKFYELTYLIKREKIKYLRSPKHFDYYFTFLKMFDIGIDEYYTKMLKNLAKRGYFYDFNCIELYFKRINELIDLKKIVAEESKFLYEKSDIEDSSTLLAKANTDIEKFTEKFSLPVTDINGVIYKFGKFGKSGDPIIGFEKKNDSIRIKCKKISLEYKKGFALVDDNIYKPTNFSYVMSKYAIFIFVAAVIISGGFFMTYILLDILKILWLVSAIVFIAFAFFAITLHMLWNYNSKYRNYLLMKPFRRK